MANRDRIANQVDLIQVGDHSIEVLRRKVKHLRLSIHLPTGRIRITAPLRLGDDLIRAFVESKLGWIEKHLARIAAAKAPQLEYSSGETHFLEGRGYRLQVIPDHSINMIRLREDAIELYTMPGITAAQRPLLLQGWYRARLRVRIAPLLDNWQRIIGVRITGWGIRRMKSRWGSCNIKARRVNINLELAKRSESCLEYIIVHELVHLLEESHNARFKALMDKFLPDWRARRDELKAAPPQR